MHDYSYEFREIDSLSRRKSMFSILKVFDKLICVTINIYSDFRFHPLSTFIASSLSLIDFFREIPYYDIRILKLSLQFSLTNMIISILVMLAANIKSFKSLFVTTLILLVLAFKIGSSLFEIFQQKIVSKFSLQLDEIDWKQGVRVSQLDFYIRILSDESISFHYEDYMHSKQQVFWQTIILDHIQRCVKSRDQCYCQEYSKQIEEQNGMVNKKYLLGEDERKKFLKDYILEMFEKYLEKNGPTLSTIRLEFFFFLHDYVNNPTKAIILLHNLLKESGKEASMQQKALLSYIHQFLTKDYFINQKQLYKDKFLNYDLQMVLDYDDKIKEFQKQLITALEFKKQFLSVISKDLVNLESAITDGQKLIKLRQKLHKDLIWLSKEKLLDIYIMNLSFGDYKTSYYRKLKKYSNNKIESDLFIDDQCVMFISLLKGTLGQIKRVSDSFESIFQIPASDAINKNCNIIMAPSIGKIHNDFLNSMIERGSIHESRVKQFKLLFGVSKNDFAIPLEVNIKLDYVNTTEFGVSALIIHKNTSDQNFIILDGSNCMKIFKITEGLFFNLFKKCIRREDIEKVYLDQLIPVISGYINKRLMLSGQDQIKSVHDIVQHTMNIQNIIKEEPYIDTICFLPQSNSGKKRLFQKMEDLEKEINNHQLFNLMENDMYQLRIEIQFLTHELVKQCYIQVKNFRQIKRISDKKAELNTFQQQLKKYCNVHFNIETSSSILKVSKLLSTRNYQGQSKRLLSEDSVHQKSNNQKQKQLEQSSLKDIDTSSIMSEAIRKQNVESIYQQQSAFNVNEPASPTLKKNQTSLNDKLLTEKQKFIDDTSSSSSREDAGSQRVNLSIKNEDSLSQKSSQSQNQFSNSKYSNIKNETIKKSAFSQQDALNNYQMLTPTSNDYIDLQKISNVQSSVSLLPKSSQQISNVILDDKKNSSIKPPLTSRSYFNFNFTNDQNKLNHHDKNDHQIIDMNIIKDILSPNTPMTPLTSYRMDYNISTPTQTGLISPKSNVNLQLLDSNDQQNHQYYWNKPKKTSEASTIAAQSQITHDNGIENKFKLQNIKEELHKINSKQTSKMDNTEDGSKFDKLQGSTHSFKSIEQSVQLKLQQAQKQIKSIFQQKKRQSIKRQSRRMTRFSQKVMSETENSERKQRRFDLDASSVNSQTDNQFYAKKQFLIEKIKSKKYSSSLIVINAFSLFSLLTIILVSIYFFLQIIQLFDEQNKNFSYIPWGMKFRTTMSTAVKDTNLYELINYNKLMDNVEDIPNFKIKVQSRLQNNMADMKGYISEYMNHEKINFKGKQFLLNNQTQLRTYTNTSKYSNNTESIGYLLEMYTLTMYQYSVGIYQKGATEMTVYNNFVNISNQLSALQNVTLDANYDYYNQIENINLILLLINCSLCTFIAVSIVVIYGYLQNEKEKILSLLTTIDFNHIKDMYHRLVNTMQSILNKNYVVDYSQEYQFNQKKKQISQNTSLPKIKLRIVLLCLIFLIMVCLYPLIQYVTSNGYIKQNKINMQLINQIYNVKAQYLSNMAAHVAYIITRCVPGLRIAPLSTHLPRIKQLQSQNSPILQALSESIKNLEDNVSYRSSDYKSFLFNILNLNACKPFEDNQSYESENRLVNQTSCKKLFNGILEQGLQISSVKLFDTYDQLVEIYSIKDDQQFNTKIKNFFIQQNSLKDIDDLYEIMSNIIISLHNFINVMNDDYFQLNYFIQEILMVYQFLLFCVLYLIVWIPFQRSIQEELTKAKIILTNFEISYLIENPYIMNFLKKY